MIEYHRKETPSKYNLKQILMLVLVVGAVFTAATIIFSSDVTAQESPINIEESHETELVGYSEGQVEQSHHIENNLELRFSGEDAQDVEIIIQPGEHTVINTATVDSFVQGDSDVSINRQDHSGDIILSTDSVPEETTMVIEFETIFVGGTTISEDNSASTQVNYESIGGTPGDESYTLSVDLSSTADNRIDELEGSEGISTLQQLFSYIGVGGLLLLIVVIGLRTIGVGGDSDDEIEL